MDNKTTHFGFKEINASSKEGLVQGVFDSVAQNYDLMNDILSFGMHRLWKRYTLLSSGVQVGERILDIAGGTGDMASQFARKLGDSGEVVLVDINLSMLKEGRKKLLNQGDYQIKLVQASAEALCFKDNYFDCISIAFGLRNMTYKKRALKESYRVLKPGGRLVILEFSKVQLEILHTLYDAYSFRVMPKLGALFARDRGSYEYLAESIRRHPDQESLKKMILSAGFKLCEYHNLSGGIVALHKGIK